MKGRRPTPTNLKVLHGNPGKRPLNTHEPKPPPAAPAMPHTMSSEAEREWRRVVPVLDRLGLLTKVDRGALVLYCTAYGQAIEADKMIQRHGAVLVIEGERYRNEEGEVVIVPTPVKNPYVAVYREAAALAKAYQVEFGLTPSARARLKSPEEADDSLEELLGRRRDPSA